MTFPGRLLPDGNFQSSRASATSRGNVPCGARTMPTYPRYAYFVCLAVIAVWLGIVALFLTTPWQPSNRVLEGRVRNRLQRAGFTNIEFEAGYRKWHPVKATRDGNHIKAEIWRT